MTVGPPPRLGERHAFELHPECAAAWETFVERARTLASNGARESLLAYPVEHGVDELVADERQ